MENPILILVLSNGDQLIGKVEESSGAYICTDVLQIMTEVGQDGSMRMGTIPYLPFADDTGIAIPSATTILAKPNQELLDYYNQRFGNIITPTLPKIIL